jgi:hypothetical protein
MSNPIIASHSMSNTPCPACAGRGWVRTSAGALAALEGAPWFKCTACKASGFTGMDIPEVLTSDGRLVRGVTWFRPAKPAPPVLRAVKGGGA